MRQLRRALASEMLGSVILLATVVGSGIMADRLAGGNAAVALLGNTLPISTILIVLVTMLGPLSGAHFNPVVTLVFAIMRELSPAKALAYMVAQIAGAVAGVWLAHAMFGEAILQVAQKVRTGPDQWLAEVVATFGLIVIIFGTLRARAEFVPVAVGLYIFAACWFTASTSFANPAVTLARSLSDTFVGIRPEDAPGFIAAQLAGALAGLVLSQWLFAPQSKATS